MSSRFSRWLARSSSLLVLVLVCADGARILFHLPTPTHSHNTVYHPVIREMAKRGHQVVTITTQPLEDAAEYSNLREIDVRNESVAIWRRRFDRGTEDLTVVQTTRLFTEVMIEMLNIHLSHSEVKTMIQNKTEHFDLVVVEIVKYNVILAWSHRFNCPMIGMISLDMTYEFHDAMGNPYHPYLYSNFKYNFRLTPSTSFMQRMKAIYLSIFVRWNDYFKSRPSYDAVIRKYFGENTPGSSELIKNLDLVFVNQNVVINPRPKVPGCVYMDMMHIKDPKPLPQELKEFFNESTNGVIYFSMGSNVKSSSLPREKINTFLRVFARLPYQVLWKWERNELPGMPPNLKICQWCPQQDILAHKNVKLFITQGGLQSMEEAIHYRKPILGMPLIIDQKQNILNLKDRGCGEMLDFDEITEDSFYDLITKIIGDDSYRSNINKLATVMEDKPMKSLQKVVWWIEYVLRHKGAKHLKGPTLPWYLHFMLDFVLVSIFTALAIAYSINKIFHFLYKHFCAANENCKIKIKSS